MKKFSRHNLVILREVLVFVFEEFYVSFCVVNYYFNWWLKGVCFNKKSKSGMI